MNFFNIIEKIKNFYNTIKLDNNEKFFIKKNIKRIKNFSHKKKNVFIEINPGYYYLIYYKFLINSGKFDNYNFIGIWTHVLYPVKKKFTIEIFFKLYYLIFYFLLKKKFFFLYKSIGVSKFLDLNANVFHNKKILNLKKKSDLYLVNFRDINIGDLLYDSYLRYRCYPTVRLNDSFLNYLFNKSKLLYKRIDKFKKKYEPRFYFANSSSYINHGIPYRYFLKKNIPVISGQTGNSYNSLMSFSNMQSFIDFQNYKNHFQKLKEKKKILLQSKVNLLKRFSGKNQFKKDASYMHVDPYKEYSNSFSFRKKFFSNEIKGIFFLQDFFDSPAAWGKNVFDDVYLCTVYTLILIKKYKLPIAIKPHPNAFFFRTDTIKIVSRLKSRFPSLLWLDPKTSNKIIFPYIKYGISATGSILFELAYHGIKAISCGRHPAEKFNFTVNANSKKDYKNLLINIDKIKKPKFSSKDLHAFNYMHYLNNSNIFFKLNFNYEKLKKINFESSSILKKIN
jgi:hypothetical protein